MTGPEPWGTLDLAPVGNCAVTALVDRQGRYVWSCLPRVDGEPFFSALLGGTDPDNENATGFWAIDIENLAGTRQQYRRNSAILHTILTDRDGNSIEIVDFAPRFAQHGRLYRPIAFVRQVRPLSGAPRVRVRLRPVAGWNGSAPERTSGSNHIRYLVPGQPMRLSTDAAIGNILDERWFRLEQETSFFLGADEALTRSLLSTGRDMHDATLAEWQHWSRGLATPLEWQGVVIRAAIALKLCVHEETGAIVAALTTSIPEAPDSGRTWDYRYCWLRDAYYTVQALNGLGALDVLENYLGFLRNIVDQTQGGHIQPLFGVGFETMLSEHIAPDLPGYRGMGPVRVGNQAHQHVQHDVYGQVVLSNVQAFFDQRLLRPATVADFQSLERVGDRAFAVHDQPDASLWEFRTRSSVHTYSALMCWAACDRLANAAAVLALPERAAHWQARADIIRARIERDAWNEELGHFASTFGGSGLDASLLQMIEVRFIAPDDPRFVATFAAIEKHLRRGDAMLRYADADDFGTPETAFNVCTFWLIEALHLVGRTAEARDLFNTATSRLTNSDLLSEDSDFETGGTLGQFPANLFACRPDQLRDHVEQAMERRPMSRLIVVSNRVAAPTNQPAGDQGGLSVALAEALREYGGLWFGWSGECTAEFTGRITTAPGNDIITATIDLEEQDIQEYYNGYANKTLWPLFHYRIDLTEYDRTFDAGYARVNQRFADTLVPILAPDDTDWVHDYHLIPLAMELRKRGVTNRIGFFLHIPWPPPRLLTTLPHHQALVQSLFDYDLVGFQTREWHEAFDDYLAREADMQANADGSITAFGKTTRIGVFPIGIDTKAFQDAAESPEAMATRTRIASSIDGRKMIVGVDRLDYSKGLEERFLAYERFLADNPELCRHVFMLQIAPPTRGDIGSYQEIRSKLDMLSGRINGSYAEFDWVPIRYVNRGYSRSELAAIYRSARIGLVTPLRDGMNLVAKEYVAAQDPGDPGVLILSRFAGAAMQMSEAVLINPYSQEEMADAIRTGLDMPLSERKQRWNALIDSVVKDDVLKWRTDFVAALNQAPRRGISCPEPA